MQVCCVLATLAIAPAAPAATVGLNFTGMTLNDELTLHSGAAPPDTMGGVGPNHIVELLNGGFAVFDKSTGAVVGSKMSDQQFWINAGLAPSAAMLTDTRVIYDRASQRWFATEMTNEDVDNTVRVAVSNNSDPTQGWKGASFAAAAGVNADFAILGMDASGVYIGTNNFSGSTGTLVGVSLYSIPKADLLAAAPTVANLTRFDGMDTNTVGFTLQTAVDFGPAKGHAAVLSTQYVDPTVSPQPTTLDRMSILNAAGPGPATLSAPTPITVPTYAFPRLGRQPDGTRYIDTTDSRISSTVWQQGNNLWAAQCVNTGNHATIRWYQIDETSNALLQSGTIDRGSATVDCFMPSIAVNASGAVVIGFNSSSFNEDGFVSSYAVVGTTDAAGITTFDTPMLLKQGLIEYHLFSTMRERWGDFSQTVADPSDPNVFWTFQEFPTAINRWATQITQIIVPEPASIVLLALAAASLLLAARCSRRARG